MSSATFWTPGLADLGERNEPNGYPGINGSGVVFGTFGQFRATRTEILALPLKLGQLAFATDTEEMYIGDGTTAGGLFLWQKPQWQTNNFTGFVGPPALGAATTTESLIFPQMRLPHGYRIKVESNFSGGGSNSNFGVYVELGIDFTDRLGMTARIREVWVDGGGDEIEKREYLNVGSFLSMQFELASNLTESFATLLLDIDVWPLPDTDLAPFPTQVDVDAPMSITPVKRTGQATSTHAATIAATIERTQLDKRVF